MCRQTQRRVSCLGLDLSIFDFYFDFDFIFHFWPMLRSCRRCVGTPVRELVARLRAATKHASSMRMNLLRQRDQSHCLPSQRFDCKQRQLQRHGSLMDREESQMIGCCCGNPSWESRHIRWEAIRAWQRVIFSRMIRHGSRPRQKAQIGRTNHRRVKSMVAA